MAYWQCVGVELTGVGCPLHGLVIANHPITVSLLRCFFSDLLLLETPVHPIFCLLILSDHQIHQILQHPGRLHLPTILHRLHHRDPRVQGGRGDPQHLRHNIHHHYPEICHVTRCLLGDFQKAAALFWVQRHRHLLPRVLQQDSVDPHNCKNMWVNIIWCSAISTEILKKMEGVNFPCRVTILTWLSWLQFDMCLPKMFHGLWQHKGKPVRTKMDEFSKNFRRGGRSFPIQKISLQFFCIRNCTFGHEFPEKLPIWKISLQIQC